MSKPGQDIDIALAFDERFWAPAYATMRGICLATKRRGDLIFHLCHNGLSDRSIDVLDEITTEFGAALVFHDIAQDANYVHFSTLLEHSRHISEIMYARLLFDRILDPSISRLIYIDCDIFVRGPIENLFASDLAGRPLGAMKDAHAMVSSNRRDIKMDRDLFDPADPFFNSGMLLIDLAAWRDIDMIGKLHALEGDGILPRLYNDQQVLNYVFKNNWTQLDPSWNSVASGWATELVDPQAVHYTGPTKPWNLINPVPFRRVYRHVMTNKIYYRFWRERMWWKLSGGPKLKR